ncbi:MAG TPA: pyrimidine 5'-nucleotidase [Brevundimonas sp.]|jgi:putative hydrolase of the HAD superfamily|uniref:pyrimidine 5'-nucleotidase n=1 Tax=Brevundimonas sp. TaxID=1871086 RepID=UPI002DE3794C|nr:pyrimidine 5'-nucleotidase [Brevundimonas sp.]
MTDLRQVTAWVFDMDDTLYPREQGVMRLVQERINAFMMAAVGLPQDEARALQLQFLNEHGTTLAGLMANYAVDPQAFLQDVHDVPLDTLEPSPELCDLLTRLPGRKFVLTNGARMHADRVLARIGVSACFDGVFCIEDMDLVPKPAPATFRRFLDAFGVDPHAAAFFEDTPRNLMPAKALGMTTVLIGDGHGHEVGDWVDHRADRLLDFLRPLALRDAA